MAPTPLWGLARVIPYEHPEIWGGIVDLDPAGGERELEMFLQEIEDPDGEHQLAIRHGGRFAARLQRMDADRFRAPGAATNLSPEGTYLVTGGLGSLGLELARWLVSRGARHLVLVGRRSPNDAAREVIGDLEKDGVQIVAARGDVSNKEDVGLILANVEATLPPLKGVIHAAGVLDDGVLLMQDWQRFTKVMAPKVSGAWNLHHLTEGVSLDFFVLFSSMASLLGSPGQGNYTSANTFMDNLAHFRRSRGLPALSVNWGPWAEVGMAADLAKRSSRPWVPDGVTALALDDGLELLGRLLDGPNSQVGVIPVEWADFLDQFPLGSEPPLLADFAKDIPPERRSQKSTRQNVDLLEKLNAAPAAERRSMLTTSIQLEVGRVLGLDPSEPPGPEQAFFELGMDSLMAVELKNYLSASVGRELPSTVVFECPTIDALTDYLLDKVLDLSSSTRADAKQKDDTSAAMDELKDLSENELLSLLENELTRTDAG